MIKFNESRLPEAAREKLLSLDSRRVEEAAAAAARLPYEITDAKITQRVRASQDRHAQRHDEIHALCTHIRQWLASLSANVILELAPSVNANLAKGETAQAAIERLRDEVTAAQNNLRVVKAAPMPRSEMKAQAAAHVKALAERGRPRISVDRGFAVAFTAPNADTLAHHLDVAALMAWLYPAAMKQAFEREIDALPETQAAMPAQEREQRIAQLAADLLELERQEVSLIDRAALDGLTYRENCDPRAVLQITVAAKAKALAAA